MMGDMADDYTEQGFDAWVLHLDGRCDGPCPYCVQENGDDAHRRERLAEARSMREDFHNGK